MVIFYYIKCLEPLKFLELHYNGGDKGGKPLVLVGKGVTFDSGGISIKPSAAMAEMKGDMGGAACVFSSLWAINKLELKINVICLIPLTENMPSGKATKPGDVVKAGNGLTIEVDNTDAEGRLILCDALHYGTSFDPIAIVEMSTLTGAMVVALGECYAGVFTKSDFLAERLLKAGKAVDDEFWRMPMCDSYKPQLDSQVADLKNVGGKEGGSCTAAIFLQQFVGDYPYAHLGIYFGFND
jgi:aminopeptidase